MIEQTTIEAGPTRKKQPPAAQRQNPEQPMMPPAPASPSSPAADEVESLYIEHRKLLLFVACRKFRIPDCDAEALIQEVFLSYLQTGTKIDNVRGWLVAAICNASRHYWRASGRTESLPDNYNDHCDPSSQSLADKFATQMTMHKVLGYMQERCRETLRLHYFEGRSAVDVAKELETTTRYAEKLIHNCLRRAREIFNNISSMGPR
ncbi:MAG TPA: sigma-70 family RNA polymerase sigma factor [Thermoanaerobaculia bacterium]|nr:sigma-70 family RNA polymerase sigma factor [Thermoanaerobaculia bacterium]